MRIKTYITIFLTILSIHFLPLSVFSSELSYTGFLMENMTLEEKIGQLFIIRVEMLNTNRDNRECYQDLNSEMIDNYRKYPCGGFILFTKNIDNEEQLISLNKKLHELSKIPSFVSIDEEGGFVSRIANHPNFEVEKFPDMGEILKLEDSAYAYNAGYTIGKYLKRYGIDLNFAPVADVNTNDNNTVIGSRAFGNDPFAASWMVQSYVFGLHDSKILSCIKHFPGHGDTKNDSHLSLAYTYKTWKEMKECEMYPFIGGIEGDSEFVMVGHIVAPNVTGDDIPASLSYTLINDKLKGELGYKGLVITDGMEMGAISKNYSSAEAAVQAIKAGVDIILLPENYYESFIAIKNAVVSGDISEERIDESVRKILELKIKHFEMEPSSMIKIDYRFKQNKRYSNPLLIKMLYLPFDK